MTKYFDTVAHIKKIKQKMKDKEENFLAWQKYWHEEVERERERLKDKEKQ